MTLDYHHPPYCTDKKPQGSEGSADLPKGTWLIGSRVGIRAHAVLCVCVCGVVCMWGMCVGCVQYALVGVAVHV